MFLTVDELRTLTGYQRPSAQARWLRKHGFRFKLNGLGEPVVAVAEVDRTMIGKRAARREPNFEALDGTQTAT